MNYQTVIILVFILSSCNTQLVKFYDGNENYKPLFNKKKIKPLKEEWKELYLYLQSGHVLQKKEERAVTYIYSYELYKYLHKNMKKIHHTSYLSKYQNMVDVFGEPDAVFEDKRYINLNYMVHIVDDPCETCTHSGFSFLFDKTTKIIDGYVDKEDE